MTLSTREQTLLGLLGAVVVIAVVYFLTTGLAAQQEALGRQLNARTATLREIQRLTRTLDALESAPAPPRNNRPLIGRLEAIAGEAGVAGGLQLNLMPGDRKDDLEAAEARVDELSLDQLVGFVHAIEDARPLLVIDHIELSPAFRDKTRLRATLRVLARR